MAAMTSNLKTAFSSWTDRIHQAEKTCFVHCGKRKIHYKFTDGQEMVEEYDLKTEELIGRKLRERTAIGCPGQWCVEVGEPAFNFKELETDGLRENDQNPTFYRLDTRTKFQWKVRNAPPPLSNYQVTVDPDAPQIIIKTLNKKFYKKFSIPDLDRNNFLYDSKKLSIMHQLNTLIIQYDKPPEILRIEEDLRRELRELKPHEEPSECQQS